MLHLRGIAMLPFTRTLLFFMCIGEHQQESYYHELKSSVCNACLKAGLAELLLRFMRIPNDLCILTVTSLAFPHLYCYVFQIHCHVIF